MLAADGGTLAGLAGCRRLPADALLGIERHDLWWSLRVAAVNLRRLVALGLAGKTAPRCWPDIRCYRPGAA
jgi:hypothetical protein